MKLLQGPRVERRRRAVAHVERHQLVRVESCKDIGESRHHVLLIGRDDGRNAVPVLYGRTMRKRLYRMRFVKTRGASLMAENQLRFLRCQLDPQGSLTFPTPLRPTSSRPPLGFGQSRDWMGIVAATSTLGCETFCVVRHVVTMDFVARQTESVSPPRFSWCGESTRRRG